MSWRLAHKGEYKDSEWVEFGGVYRCVIPIYYEKSKELATLGAVRQDWHGSWVETAQAQVIRVREGYFVINPSGFQHRPPIFEELPDPRPHCSIRRVS